MEPKITELQEIVWKYSKEHRRPMKWRDTIDPYWILLSEIMLQQTQVPRVMIKFEEFIETFPTLESLAEASLSDVLRVWQGMGYNRRGKFLWQTAQIIVNEHNGGLPQEPDVLVKVPGIGPATAASIACYAYNLPVMFIETNVRRVFIHHCFADSTNVSDKDIEPLVQQAVDLNSENAREWYYALMDYGTYLKTIVPNPNRKSKHYTRQSQFEGSNRQVRAQILRFVLEAPRTRDELTEYMSDERRDVNIQALITEGLIEEVEGVVRAV